MGDSPQLPQNINNVNPLILICRYLLKEAIFFRSESAVAGILQTNNDCHELQDLYLAFPVFGKERNEPPYSSTTPEDVKTAGLAILRLNTPIATLTDSGISLTTVSCMFYINISGSLPDTVQPHLKR